MELNLSPELQAKLVHIAAETAVVRRNTFDSSSRITSTMTRGSGKRQRRALGRSESQRVFHLRRSGRAHWPTPALLTAWASEVGVGQASRLRKNCELSSRSRRAFSASRRVVFARGIWFFLLPAREKSTRSPPSPQTGARMTKDFFPPCLACGAGCRKIDPAASNPRRLKPAPLTSRFKFRYNLSFRRGTQEA